MKIHNAPQRGLTVRELIDLLKNEDQTDIVCVETFTLPKKAGRWHLLTEIEHDVFTIAGETYNAVSLIGYSRRGDERQ